MPDVFVETSLPKVNRHCCRLIRIALVAVAYILWEANYIGYAYMSRIYCIQGLTSATG